MDTPGGNLCNASPSADGICPLIAYNAVCHIAGPGGDDDHRDIAVEDFCTGPGSNVLGRGEILVSMVLPNPGDNFGAAYERFIPRNEMDIAVAGAGVSVRVGQGGGRHVHHPSDDTVPPVGDGRRIFIHLAYAAHEMAGEPSASTP